MDKNSHLNKNWYLIDAEGRSLGRLSSHIATLLMGKHKPNYAPHLKRGDYLIVINTDKISVGDTNKMYYNHSGYPGGLRSETFEKLVKRFPEKILERSVKGMLPKNRLGRSIFTKLKVFPSHSHPHTAQNPILLSFTE